MTLVDCICIHCIDLIIIRINKMVICENWQNLQFNTVFNNVRQLPVNFLRNPAKNAKTLFLKSLT